MSRGLSGTLQAELAKDQFRFAHLVQVQLNDSQYVRVTDSFHDLTHLSNTYLATGTLLNMTPIKESAVLQIGKITISLSGVNTDVMYAARDETFINRQVIIYRAIINPETGVYIDTPRQIFDGTISNYSIAETAVQSSVSIVVASNWANFQQINGRVTNSESQRKTKRYGSTADFNHDLGMQYASSAIADIKWGQD